MSRRPVNMFSRRHVLAGMASAVGTRAFAAAPEVSERPKPRGVSPMADSPSVSEKLIKNAGLGGVVGYAVTDVASGQVLESRYGDTMLPPASTLKAVTTIYALDRLGPSFQFRTEVLGTGPIENGRLKGDLILKGGGDPTLDTDRLADLAVALREAGVHEVTGRFLVCPGDLPRGDRIDHEQPDHVAYNPAYGGLNLNFNRVHFEWKKAVDDYEITMQARGLRFRPATSVAQMSIVDRKVPVYDYWASRDKDIWSVARGALGKNGARWLPVRFPAVYAADVFKTLARSNGIVLKRAEIVDQVPDGQVLVSTESDLLVPMMIDMLKYSTNLTAEMTGLSASVAEGVPVSGLIGSGARMSLWAIQKYGIGDLKFSDHSGLGYDSAISPLSMAKILQENDGISVLLKPVNLSVSKSRPAPNGVEVKAKTGTLNFVSSLAGFVTTQSGRKLCFSILTADTLRRDAIPPEQRERPRGAKSWSRRSRQLQKELIRSWADRYDGELVGRKAVD